MSIPPLVCSTPPPPEQCEDDKDPEDFDLTYNLSQEDDDDSTEYNYGNYSSYNIYPTKSDETDTEKWQPHFCKNLESTKEGQVKSESITNSENFMSDNMYDENVPKFEENILEDLNLKVEADIEHSNDMCNKEYKTESDIYNTEELSEKNTGIQDQGGTDIIKNNEVNTTIENPNIDVDHIISEDNENLGFENDEIVNNVFNELSETHMDKILSDDTDNDQIPSRNDVITGEKESDILENIDIIKDEDKHSSDDDFGDFEDFQMKSSNNSQVVVPLSSDSPWDNNTDENSEFGTFTANFDSNSQKLDKDSNNKIGESVIATNNNDFDDEDFGDFDDFKSSNKESNCKDDIEYMNNTSNVPVLNFHSQDNEIQIMDTLNNVLTSIFSNEIPESDNDLDDKLELYLSETWGHLIDIDVRQPYIVNWNNSLAQKTLLKALCIDSRNILFGHKWNYNMPKYAANLTAAPLQPQKQQAQPAVSNTDISEKPQVSNEAGTWVDPFTPDGQEYTYAEALLLDLEHLMATLDQMAHKHSTLKISELLSHACSTENKGTKVESPKRPTDLDVFGSEPSPNINKIYSSTISVQPLRHINLPDTHIFTPTDSETPRSKTIHYDDGPVLVPNPVVENNKNDLESTTNQPEEGDSKYWEFQEFKGTNADDSIVKSSSQETQQTVDTTNDTASKVSATYQTQILQPIKIEPIIPTLNWPDPGEVKETFDDFSDFISSTSWSNDKDINIPDVKNNKPEKNEQNEGLKTVTNDDDFETFQSAPVSNPVSEIDICDNQARILESSSKNTTENGDKIGMNNFKELSEVPVEIPSCSIPTNIPIMQNLNSAQTSIGNPVNCLVNSNSILQPTSSSANVPRSQHNTGQILQPLSLESYSQINWPNPGIDLQDLSRFNPVNSLQSLKCDMNPNNSKSASPAHNSMNVSEISDDDIWGDFVSSAPKSQTSPKKPATFADDDEWTDFVSSPSIRPQNGLNTISLNVHTNLNMQKSTNHNKISSRSNQMSIDIPTLNYITPKSNNRGMYTDRHFQNL